VGALSVHADENSRAWLMIHKGDIKGDIKWRSKPVRGFV
jgi:hypothetical protein